MKRENIITNLILEFSTWLKQEPRETLEDYLIQDYTEYIEEQDNEILNVMIAGLDRSENE